MSRSISLFVLLAIAGAAPAQEEPLVKKVKTSIARGVAFLIDKQQGGSWGDIDNDKDAYRGGPTALALLALLNCDDILNDDPKLEARRLASIKSGLQNLRTVDSRKVYVRALQTMALAEAGDKKDYDQIKKNIDWLLEARVYRDGKLIGWNYGKDPLYTEADASNSQYAMLALWYGRQAGVPIDRKVWLDIRAYYAGTQHQDGYWTYSPYYGPKEERGSSQTMTIAGLCGLLIAGMELNADREAWPPNGKLASCGNYPEHAAAALAMHWIGKHFTLELSHRTFYHLYGIERAGRLSGERFFGAHDWYREGCEYLTRTQNKIDGSWTAKNEGWDRWPHVNTSFALLFLSKGRTPVLISKLVHGNFPRRADDADWNNDRHDLKNLTEYLARQPDLFGKKPLAWQTFDIKRALIARNVNPDYKDEAAVVAEMKQTPILYITGHQSPAGRIQDEETALIKRYVENGGFILAEACCGDPRFDDGIKQWVKDTWNTELKYVDTNHPVWTCYNRIVPGASSKLMAVELGCRTMMIYSPQDLSCHWESNRSSDKPTKAAFELGANIVVYATGKTPPRPRLTGIEIADGPKQVKESRARGAFRVMQVKHSDQWQPAPKAMSNLMEHVHKVTGLDVKLQPGELLLGKAERVQAAKFLYLHGKGAFRVGADLDPLRFTLQNGGLLFADACCGDPVFDKSFRKFVQDLFPKEKLVRVPIDENERDRLFSAKRNDGEALTAANIQCRTEPGGKVRPMEPFLEGIRIEGRWVVLYSKYDIGCALEHGTPADCVGYDPDSALRIATAAVRYNIRP